MSEAPMDQDRISAVLKTLIDRYGRSLISDPGRLERLLKDFIANVPNKERLGLVAVAKANLSERIAATAGHIITALQLEKWVAEIHDETGIDISLLRRSFRIWAHVFDLTVEASIPDVDIDSGESSDPRSGSNGKDRVNLDRADREFVVDGVLRRLSNYLLIAPPIPSCLGDSRETGTRFGYSIEDFKASGDFVKQGDPLWRFFSYPPMLGPIPLAAHGDYDAIVHAPCRGLFLGRSWNGLGKLERFDSQSGYEAENRSFSILLFEGDEPHYRQSESGLDHFIASVKQNYGSFVRPKRNFPPELHDLIERLRKARPIIVNVNETNKVLCDDAWSVREAIMKARATSMGLASSNRR